MTAVFYRGAGVGTYWHQHDGRLTGFTAHNPTGGRDLAALIGHIRAGTTFSAFISLTRSYGVAFDYAMAGRKRATKTKPAYVYEIKISNPLPAGLVVIDPVNHIASEFSDPINNRSYQHDGDQNFLLGIINPTAMRVHLKRQCRQPEPAQGVRRPPNLSHELETLVRALRDAELLAVASIPSTCVTNRFEIY